jgi:hypothetical protein
LRGDAATTAAFPAAADDLDGGVVPDTLWLPEDWLAGPDGVSLSL